MAQLSQLAKLEAAAVTAWDKTFLGLLVLPPPFLRSREGRVHPMTLRAVVHQRGIRTNRTSGTGRAASATSKQLSNDVPDSLLGAQIMHVPHVGICLDLSVAPSLPLTRKVTITKWEGSSWETMEPFLFRGAAERIVLAEHARIYPQRGCPHPHLLLLLNLGPCLAS